MTSSSTADLSEELLQLVPHVSGAVDGSGDLRLLTAHGRTASLGPAAPWKVALLKRLAETSCPVPELQAVGRERGRASPTGGDVSEFLGSLQAGGWVVTTVCWGQRPRYALEPLGQPPAAPGAADGEVPPRRLVLSRFAQLSRGAGHMVLESPRSWALIRIHDPAVLAALGALAQPVALDEPAGPLPAAATARLLADLHRTGLAVGTPGLDDTDLRLRQWKAHDLWFHNRSRFSARSALEHMGRTEWAKGLADPPPARRPLYPGRSVELYRPDLDALRRGDPSLTAVLEDRRSIREHDEEHPVTAGQLGELLFRCARVRESVTADDGAEYLSKPYPSGGAAYELELYPVVRLASGLAPGMYHYDPQAHRLTFISRCDLRVAGLLDSARAATGQRRAPQVLIHMTARFGRVMQTYEGIAYALVLKHVGVLCQTMSLVATAMGLASCCVGSGPATAFNDITGTDYADESSVGEFALGSRHAAA